MTLFSSQVQAQPSASPGGAGEAGHAGDRPRLSRRLAVRESGRTMSGCAANNRAGERRARCAIRDRILITGAERHRRGAGAGLCRARASSSRSAGRDAAAARRGRRGRARARRRGRCGGDRRRRPRARWRRGSRAADASAPLDLVIANAGISGGTAAGRRQRRADAARSSRSISTACSTPSLPALPPMQARGARPDRADELARRPSAACPARRPIARSKAAVRVWGEGLRGAARAARASGLGDLPGLRRARDDRGQPLPDAVPDAAPSAPPRSSCARLARQPRAHRLPAVALSGGARRRVAAARALAWIARKAARK